MSSLVISEQLVHNSTKIWDGTSDCTTITIHETANTRVGAGARAHANLQSAGNVRQASWHYQVEEDLLIQSFPDRTQCWHAGWAARDSIAIEMCVNRDSDYDKTLESTAWLVGILRDRHGLGRDDLRTHNDWTGKNCPSRLRSIGGWSEFVASTDPGGAMRAPKAADDGKGAAGLGGGRSVRAMALEVIAGLHGNGHERRRKSLGISQPLYTQVRATVNQIATGVDKPFISPGKSVSQMAEEIIDGKHGNGHEHRRRSLGVSDGLYDRVRAEVNRRLGLSSPNPPRKSISQMASEVLAGLHGNGHENRRRSLGINKATYSQVRAEVNRRA